MQPKTAASGYANPVTPGKTILVVEDDPAIRRGLVDALRFAGYSPIA